MSEFQYYDFRAVDRPLTEGERKEVASWSSRSKVSANRAVFSYSYGDFRKDIKDVTMQYFDAAFYSSSWGTQHILFRFPKTAIDYKAISVFDIDGSEYTGVETGIEITRKGDYVLISIEYGTEDGGGEWIDEDDDSLSDVLPLREDILRGDYRSLFAFWLHIAHQKYQTGEADEDLDEADEDFVPMPPIPADLKKKSAALTAFMNIFDIDNKLISAAAKFSPEVQYVEPAYETLLAQLDAKEKDAWLLRVLKSELRLDSLLRKRLAEFQPKQTVIKSPKVSLDEIFDLLD